MARPLKFRFRLGLLAALAGALALTAIAPARQAISQQERIRAEERKLQELSIKNAELAARLERLKDVEYMELLAREQLGLVKPGEVSFVVLPPPATSTATVQEPSVSKNPAQKVWQWIRSLFS